MKSQLVGKTTMSEDIRSLDAQLDPVLVREALALIEPAQRILLIAHEHPDGDPLLRVGRAAGLQEEIHHLFVGPAVQPALEGPNGGHNSGVQIRFRGDDDARRERRGVELMFSIEDE